jgi:oligoendopeptidase F
MQFFILNLGKIPKKLQKEFLSNNLLIEYKHFLERIFKKSKYFLSEKEEKILNLKSKTSYSSWVDMVSGFIAKEEREVLDESGNSVKKNYQEMTNLMMSHDKKIRDSSAIAFNDIMDKYSDLAENEINAILSDKKVNDELRGYKRPDYSRHLNNEVPSEVVDLLIKLISERFDISREFYKFKTKILGLEKLEYHERNIEVGSVCKEYNYQDSVNIVYSVLKNLDNEISEIFKNFIKNSQIDVYPKAGKKGGAWCFHTLITQPTYIILNHTDKLDNVLTLAHESGHGINNELIRNKQISLYYGTSTATAEVASTFIEDFVLLELLKNSDDETKFILTFQRLEDCIRTIIRQIACYKFEQELHFEFRKKGYLSKQEIGKIFQKNMSAYMGDYVIQSPGSENWWVYWPHIRDYFYTYSYAFGLLISKALNSYVKEDPNFIIKVKDFLSAGLSKSPDQIFLDLGVNIREEQFWKKGLAEIYKLFEETKFLAKKLGKI